MSFRQCFIVTSERKTEMKHTWDCVRPLRPSCKRHDDVPVREEKDRKVPTTYTFLTQIRNSLVLRPECENKIEEECNNK